jgi:polysaccharide pyruvyl transferase CsaB
VQIERENLGFLGKAGGMDDACTTSILARRGQQPATIADLQRIGPPPGRSPTTAIGITGSYGGLNAGDEAILTAMIAALRGALSDVSLTVFSRVAPQTRAHHAVEAVVPVRSLARKDVRRHVASLDLLLLGGGGILYDGEARHYLREVRLAQQAGVATMAYAVGAGPLTDPEDRRVVQELLPLMDAVTVRDAGAGRILEDIGVDCDVEVTADPALLLDPEPFSDTQLRLEGIPPGRRLVGLSLREPGRAAPGLDAEDAHRVLAQVADFAVDRLECDIVFIPMEECDIRLSHAVISRMMRAHRGHVLTGRYSPRELLGLMQHLTMVIGMRLHLLIFAALADVPLFALPYAPKVADFLDAIGTPPNGRLDGESVGALLAAIDRAWDLRQQRAADTSKHVAALRRRSSRTVDIALDCLARAPATGRSALRA